MFHRFRIILFIAVLVVIGAAITWYLRWHAIPPAGQGSTQVSQKLSVEQYRQQVAEVLSQVAAAPSDSLPAALNTAVTHLQSLIVNDQVKYDHLTLFTAFDLWAKQNPPQIALIKTKLQTFAKNQTWSAESIQSLLAKLPSS
ncbi:MAG: hypothetical protein V1846_04965 [Candidatus Komeilibacteria bacterium]